MNPIDQKAFINPRDQKGAQHFTKKPPQSKPKQYETQTEPSYLPYTKVGKQLFKNKDLPLKDFIQNNQILEPELFRIYKKELLSRVVSVSRISHTLKSGKVYLFRVVVVVGSTKGVIGVGVGKAISKVDAIKKAQLNARKELISLTPLCHEERYSPVKKSFHKFGATKISVIPLSGGSITCSKNGKIYCEYSGLTNIKIYVGSKKRDRKGKVGSALNYFKALHEAVKKQLL